MCYRDPIPEHKLQFLYEKNCQTDYINYIRGKNHDPKMYTDKFENVPLQHYDYLCIECGKFGVRIKQVFTKIKTNKCK